MDRPIPTQLEISRRQDGKNDTRLLVKVLENGDLRMEGHDLGETPQRVWGRDEYEYSVTVPAEYKDYLLLLLVKDKFVGEQSSSDFMDWLKAHQIPFEFFNWP